MPKINAIPSTGKPTWPSTMASIIKPALGTAAVPTDANVAVSITVTKSANARSDTVDVGNEHRGHTLHDRGAIHVNGGA